MKTIDLRKSAGIGEIQPAIMKPLADIFEGPNCKL